MKILKFSQTESSQKSIMLGFFDCLHLGHRALLKEAQNLPYKKSVFTFSDKVQKNAQKNVYTFDERVEVFKNAGFDFCIYADFDNHFKSLPPKRFLDFLVERQNIKAIITGFDYKFGFNASADTEFLKNYCLDNQIIYKSVGMVKFLDEKASSSLVKKYLSGGDVSNANKLLGENYHISGKVIKGRGVGRKIQFPTANIDFSPQKSQIADGVYGGFSIIDNKRFNAIINVGAKPTFNVEKRDIEVHFIDFDGDLYGRKVTVYFKNKIRDIIKFESARELASQIKKDLGIAND